MMMPLSLAMVALVAASRPALRAICNAPIIMAANMPMIVIVTSSSTRVKPGERRGDSPHLCEAPCGPFRQMGTVPFLGARGEGLGTRDSGLGTRDCPLPTARIPLRSVRCPLFTGHSIPPTAWPDQRLFRTPMSISRTAG